MLKRTTKPAPLPAIQWQREPWTIDAIACVATIDLLDDLNVWLLTASAHHPEASIVVVGDYAACNFALKVAKRYGFSERLHRLPFLAGEGLALARKHTRRVVSHADYWKADIIWWKLRGLELLLTEVLPGAGVLFTDCDISFCAPVSGKFHGDLVLSPFYWGRYDLRTRTPDGSAPLHDAHGFFNAGYVATNRAEIATAWRDLYEQGRGGFYEQKCLEELPGRFSTEYFDQRHNFGKWRFTGPPPNVVSIHYHVSESHHGSDRNLRIKTWAAEAVKASTKILSA